MITIRVPRLGAYESWRASARNALLQSVPPDAIAWIDGEADVGLFAAQPLRHPPPNEAQLMVPKRFAEMARAVLCHRDRQRYDYLYRLLWRSRSDPLLLDNAADTDLHAAAKMEKAVRRDCHKMKAFVRFREVTTVGQSRRFFAAWFEPDHNIVEDTAPFFARRFADMDWLIATPKGTASFIGSNLKVTDEVLPISVGADQTDELWRTYYENIFNPARLKVKAMKSEMPRKYWKNLPEAALIPDLIATAEARATAMRERMPTAPVHFAAKAKAPALAPLGDAPAEFSSLAELRAAARQCRQCPLHCHATQTVCGEGPASANLLFVGEQPGDREDLSGRPFVGPAGQVFDEALRAAKIAREDVYVTNAVKHFKFRPQGKFRLHQSANATEIDHCKWWLAHEIRLVAPRLIVAMGSSAAYALTGQKDGLLKRRGGVEESKSGLPVLITVHPSYLLRLPVAGERQKMTRLFESDIAEAARRAALG